MAERGLEAPSRPIPFSFSVPLIEHASLEADEELQDIWARMLANAADAESGTQPRTAFIGMLKDMTAFDVARLAQIAKITPLTKNGLVYTLNFPDSDEQTDTASVPLNCRRPSQYHLIISRDSDVSNQCLATEEVRYFGMSG
jgi:hypothetical protein